MPFDHKQLILGTLGPAGTSSEHALQYYGKTFLSWTEYHYSLFETFEEVLAALVDKKIMMAIVPHAYEGINKFYINPDTTLLQMFLHDTPAYGLYKKADRTLPTECVKVASHPAPILLINYFSAAQSILKNYRLENYRLELVNSTSLAARMVNENLVDLAITNEKAAKLYDLELLTMYGPLRMGWSVFTKR